MKSSFPKKLVTVLSTLWIIAISFFYFFRISSDRVENCQFLNFCFVQKGVTWTIIHNFAHEYYFRIFSNILLKDPIRGEKLVINPLIPVLLTIFIPYFVFIIYLKFFKKKRLLEITLRPFYFFVIFYYIFLSLYFNWFYFFNFNTLPIKSSGIFTHSSILFFETVFVILCTLALGKKVYDLIFNTYEEKRLKDNIEVLFSFGLGVIMLTFIFFVFGLSHVIKPITLRTLFALIFFFSFSEIKFFLRALFKNKISVKIGFFNPVVILFFILILLIAQNALELIRPLPIGYDDMVRYMNRVKLIGDQGNLVGGYFFYPWELFLTSSYLLFGSNDSTIYLNFARNLFVIFSLIYFLRIYLAEKKFGHKNQLYLPLLMTTLFCSLPFVAFQFAKDLKVDMAGLFFAVLGTIAFWQWKSKSIQTRNNHFLYIAALFLGFSFCIKFTFGLYLLVIFIYFLYLLFKEGYAWKKSVTLVLICFFFTILTLLPFGINNLAASKTFSPKSFFITTPNNSALSKIDKLYNNLPPEIRAKTKSSGDYEEVERYAGYKKGIAKYISLPFATTFGSYINGPYVDTGFIFLALIPIALCLYIWKSKDSHKRELIGITVIYWILWLLFANGIIWYGLAGYLLLFLLLIEFVNLLDKYILLKVITSIVILIALVLNLLFRFSFLPDQSNLTMDGGALAYASGISNKNDFFNLGYKEYVGALNQINSDIEKHPEDPPKVLVVTSALSYFIKENDRSVIEDNLLDTFNKINFDRDSKKTVDRFKELNIKYIIVNTNTPKIDQTPDKTLTYKYSLLVNLIDTQSNSFQVLVSSRKYQTIIFEIK